MPRPFLQAVRGAAALVLFASVALAQPPGPGKKADPPKAPPPRESTKSPNLKLPDGTILWPGAAVAADGERILLTPQEHQQLLDQIDQLKKQLAARKAVPPSGCAVVARIEKRGESSVAAIKLLFSFRTTIPNAAVMLGGKRSFLVGATLDGKPLPVLETAEDGFAVQVDTPGTHQAVLDVECPISSRGGKPEIGFELGLPRAAITSLVFEPPAGVARVSLTTRTPDVAQPRRIAGMDVKSLASPPPMRDPFPLGSVESLELSWEPPVASPVADVVQSSDVDASIVLTESLVETIAKYKLRGTARSWRFAAPADATLTAERAGGGTPSSDPGMPVIAKPTDAAKPVWKVELPAGTTAADWVITVSTRLLRAKPTEAAFKGPFAIGPLAVLDVSRQTGSLKVTAAANTRLAFKHGPDLKQEVPPVAGPDDETNAFFRLAAGPSGNAPPAAPLITIEAFPLAGRVVIRPVYKLTLTDAGWTVRAELRIVPIRTAVNAVAIELPSTWRSVELSPPELVNNDAEQPKSEGPRQALTVRLAAEQKQPFNLVLTASVPVAPNSREATVLLPRFPNATERETAISASVPDGLELRGTVREWDGEQPAAWGLPLTASSGPDGKPLRAVTALEGKLDRGASRLDLTWSPYRPPLTAEVRADIVVHDSQLVVTQRVLLHSTEAIPRSVRFQGAPDLAGLAPFDRLAPGSWLHAFGPDLKNASLKFEFAVPLPPRPAEGGSRSVPIALVLPTGTSRTDVVTRVWVSSNAGRTVTAVPGLWRELPPDPAAERDVLPALTLAAAGSELPLTLNIRDTEDTGAPSVWVERGLLQVSTGDEGAAYRTRFLLRRWLSDSIEVRLPEALAGAVPEVYLDEPPKRIPVTITTSAGERILRVPLPEATSGRTIVLDIRYTLPNAPSEDGVTYVAPKPVAAFAGPLRWQISGPPGTVPLVLSEGRPEQRWRPRFGLFLPVAASSEELEKWFLSGTADTAGSGSSESAVVRVAAPTSITIVHLPRLALTIGGSVGVLVLGLILSRLPNGISGPLVALLAGAVAVLAILYPQPAVQVAAAAEPGIAVLLLVLALQVALRWYHHRRITYLPGFTRSQPMAIGQASPTGGSRPSDRPPPSLQGSTGSAGAAPVPVSTGS